MRHGRHRGKSLVVFRVVVLGADAETLVRRIGASRAASNALLDELELPSLEGDAEATLCARCEVPTQLPNTLVVVESVMAASAIKAATLLAFKGSDATIVLGSGEHAKNLVEQTERHIRDFSYDETEYECRVVAELPSSSEAAFDLVRALGADLESLALKQMAQLRSRRH